MEQQTKPIGQLVFTKETFIEVIAEIQKQCAHDEKCAAAFRVILPSDYTSGYDNHFVINHLTTLLKIAMNDNHKESWIEYFIWELDFGRKWKKSSVLVNGKWDTPSLEQKRVETVS